MALLLAVARLGWGRDSPAAPLLLVGQLVGRRIWDAESAGSSPAWQTV